VLDSGFAPLAAARQLGTKKVQSMHKLRPHQAAGILISLLGLVVMAGWWTHQRRLIHLAPEHFPMVFNVALCFLMAGVALVLPESRPGIQKKGQQAVGLLIAVLAGLSGLEDLLNSGSLPSGSMTAIRTRAAWRR
jgi:drug/metabolite transporter (DMT)-like permease